MSKVTLSFKERLGVGFGFLKALCLVGIALLAVPFQRRHGPSKLRRHISFALLRAFTRSFSPRALLSLSPSTYQMYRKVLSEEGLESESIGLADGTQVHLMGDRSADKVLLFFHGGGYVMPAADGHFKLLLHTIRDVEQHGRKLGVMFLQYDLCAVSPYPRQLQQAAALLEYALTTLGKKPEQILLAGDSAGGNLTLALLSHILHPHPQVNPIKMEGQFASVALLSPWVTFDTERACSMQSNCYKDALAIPVLNQWSATFRGQAPGDAYLEPLGAPSGWFQGLPVQKILVLAGADEIFVDDIRKFGGQLQELLPQTIVEVVADEAHDHLVMEFIMKEPPTQQRAIFQEWISETVNA